MKKLELKHLSGCLPYGVKIKTNNIIRTMVCELPNDYDFKKDKLISINNVLLGYGHKPILHALSDYRKEIDYNGLGIIPCVEIMRIKDNGDWLGVENKPIYENPHYVIEKLLEWHFDIHGLIEKGLAIDINSLNK